MPLSTWMEYVYVGGRYADRHSQESHWGRPKSGCLKRLIFVSTVSILNYYTKSAFISMSLQYLNQ